MTPLFVLGIPVSNRTWSDLLDLKIVCVMEDPMSWHFGDINLFRRKKHLLFGGWFPTENMPWPLNRQPFQRLFGETDCLVGFLVGYLNVAIFDVNFLPLLSMGKLYGNPKIGRPPSLSPGFLGWCLPTKGLDLSFSGMRWETSFEWKMFKRLRFLCENLSSWWFQPIWKILVKLDHFPK